MFCLLKKQQLFSGNTRLVVFLETDIFYCILVEDEANRILLRVWTFNVVEGRLESVFVIGKNEEGKKKFTIDRKSVV